MREYVLIGVSIVAVVLLVLGSLTNVVGYQTIQSSNQKVINEEVKQKELLFQTILDLANKKEIQKIACQNACPHHQSNRLVACSANFVNLGGHALRGRV